MNKRIVAITSNAIVSQWGKTHDLGGVIKYSDGSLEFRRPLFPRPKQSPARRLIDTSGGVQGRKP